MTKNFAQFSCAVNSTTQAHISEAELVKKIRTKTGNYAADLQAYVTKNGKNEFYKAEKKRLVEQVCIGTLFELGSSRTKKNATGSTGFVAFDIDGLTKEQVNQFKHLLSNQPYVRACYKSVSGLGLQGWVAYDAEKYQYRDAFLTLTAKVDALLGDEASTDKAFRNQYLPSNISYDAQIYFNPSADTLEIAVDTKTVVSRDELILQKQRPHLSIPEGSQKAYDKTIEVIGDNETGNRHNFAIYLAGNLIAYAVELETALEEIGSELTDYQKDKLTELYANEDWMSNWGNALKVRKEKAISATNVVVEVTEMPKLEVEAVKALIQKHQATKVVLRSKMATGKTTVVRKLMVEYQNVVAITNSRALNLENSAKLGLNLYSDIQDKANFKLSDGGLTTTLDSLIHFDNLIYRDCDLLFVDEVESVEAFSQLSDTLNEKRLAVRQAYDTALFHAKLTILADAYVKNSTVDYLARKFPNETILLIDNQSEATKSLCHLYQNVNFVDFMSLFIDKFENGVPIFITTDSAERTKETRDFIVQHLVGSEDEILIINSDTVNRIDIQVGLQNADEYFRKFRYVICSPSITTGIDLCTPYFKFHIHWAEGRSSSLDSQVQQIGRTRYDLETFIGVGVGHMRNACTDKEELYSRLSIKNSLDCQKLGVNLTYNLQDCRYSLPESEKQFLDMRIERQARSNKELNTLPWAFEAAIQGCFKEIKVYQKDELEVASEETKTLLKELKKARKKNQGPELLASLEPISDFELDELIAKESKTLDEQLKVVRGMFDKHLGRAATLDEIQFFFDLDLDYVKLKAIENLHLNQEEAEEKVWIADKKFINARVNLLEAVFGDFILKAPGSEILEEEIKEIRNRIESLSAESAAILDVDGEIAKTKVLRYIGFSVHRKSRRVDGKFTKVDVVDRKALDSILLAIQNKPKQGANNQFQVSESLLAEMAIAF